MNRDILYLYKTFLKGRHRINPHVEVTLSIQRLVMQRARLRELLDKAKSIKEIALVERMILENENRIINVHMRLSESRIRLLEHETEVLNKKEEEKHSDTRYLTWGEKMSVSRAAIVKINKIIEEDKETPPPSIHHGFTRNGL